MVIQKLWWLQEETGVTDHTRQHGRSELSTNKRPQEWPCKFHINRYLLFQLVTNKLILYSRIWRYVFFFGYLFPWAGETKVVAYFASRPVRRKWGKMCSSGSPVPLWWRLQQGSKLQIFNIVSFLRPGIWPWSHYHKQRMSSVSCFSPLESLYLSLGVFGPRVHLGDGEEWGAVFAGQPWNWGGPALNLVSSLTHHLPVESLLTVINFPFPSCHYLYTPLPRGASSSEDWWTDLDQSLAGEPAPSEPPPDVAVSGDCVNASVYIRTAKEGSKWEIKQHINEDKRMYHDHPGH